MDIKMALTLGLVLLLTMFGIGGVIWESRTLPPALEAIRKPSQQVWNEGAEARQAAQQAQTILFNG